MAKKNKHHAKNFLTPDKIRYMIVGVINTIIDFGILMILTFIGMRIVPANFISTGTAFIFSFIANKNYTFRSSERASSRMIVKFIAVTLISAWGIQPLVIGLTNPALRDIFHDELFANFTSKCLAIGVGLIWNYTLYSSFVFYTTKRARRVAN